MAYRPDMYGGGADVGGSFYEGPNEPPGEAPPGMEWRWTGSEWVTVPVAAIGEPTPEPEPVAPVAEAAPEVNPYTGEPEAREPSVYTPADPYDTTVVSANPYLGQDNSMFGGGAGDPTGSDVGLPQLGGPGVPVPVADPSAAGGTVAAGQAPNMFPVFAGPAYEAPAAFAPPPAFSYDKFAAPTLQDAQAEPGYDFSFNEGLRAVQNAKAARGALRTGGTLKDLIRFGQGLGQQNYQNVYNRAADVYDRNRNNAATAYMTNYGVGRDAWDRNAALAETAYDRNYKSAWDTYSTGTEGQKMTLDDLYRRWNAQLQVNKDLALAPIPGEEF